MRPTLIPFVVAVAVLGLMACTGKSAGTQGIKLEAGLRHGSADRQVLLLDLARPSTGKGPFRVIVFIHSGHSMADGERSQYDMMPPLAVCRGYVAISIDYRLVSVVNDERRSGFPSQLEDAKAAMRLGRSFSCSD